MKGWVFFILGAGLIFLKLKKIIQIKIIYIIFVFLIGIIIMYLSIHKKNKELNTPRPVYITN